MDHRDFSHPYRILIAYISVFFIWGSTYLAIRIGVHDIPPALLAGIRFVVSGVALLLVSKFRGKSLPTTRRDFVILSIVGLLLLVGGNGLVVWSEQWVPSGLAAVIVATVPLFMSSLDSLLPRGQRLSLVGWCGIIVGFAGVVILVSPNLGIGQGEVVTTAGIAGLLVASLLWSVGSVYSRHNPVPGDIFANVGVEMLAGGIVLSVIALCTGELQHARFTTQGTLALAYLIVFGSIVGFTSYGYLLRHAPPAKASTYAYVNPIVAVFLGAIILSEPVDARTLIATTIVLAGVGIVQMATMKKSLERSDEKDL